MNKFLKFNLVYLLTIIFIFFSFSVLANNSSSDTNSSPNLKDAFGNKLEEVAGEHYSPYVSNDSDLLNIIGLILNLVLSLLGVIFVILTILAGYKWMTAGGNKETVDQAKKSLTRNLIGLVIVMGAWGFWNIISIIISDF